ncbi:hypothetical protein BC941DRAFT_430246 [Chlamydoabsidia padenii]|nr:hypothetical protein BC941DRAFT_430246 [Chlamydoabsidia padenii]
MDNEGLLDWTSDFRSFSPSSSSFAPTTTPYHHTPCPFLDHHQKRDQHTFISYPPTLVPTNTHFIKNDDESKSWEMAFDWYENNISSTNNNSNDISTRHIHSDKDISVDHNPAESDQQDNSRDKDRTALDWTRMGMELQELDQDKTAIDAFRNALDLDSTILDAWLGLAISYANEHERGKVYDCLESWLDNHRTYRHLYTSTMMKDRHTILVDRFLVAARCAPGGSDDASRLIEMDADIQVILGLLFHLADDTMKSRDCFRAALACRPEDHRLWNQLGSILMAQPTLYACAMDMYLNALDLNPHYIRARYNVAILHMKMAQYEEAAHHLTIALYQQSSSRCPTVSSSPMWSSLRLVMYMLNLDHLANACNQYDLKPFEPFLKGDKNSIDL